MVPRCDQTMKTPLSVNGYLLGYTVTMEVLKFIFRMVWIIWQWRNQYVFQKKRWSADQVMERLYALEDVCLPAHQQTTNAKLSPWKPPTRYTLKANFYADV
ncbi:hypothetical protein E2542_SST02933 [Spatholobus suberectus]|nr:hypothetical protein E2542_SST02933 [Spatholobus suberectus]